MIGVLASCNQPVTLTREDDTEAVKRNMTLWDSSKAYIKATVWEQQINPCRASLQSMSQLQLCVYADGMLGQASMLPAAEPLNCLLLWSGDLPGRTGWLLQMAAGLLHGAIAVTSDKARLSMLPTCCSQHVL